jgi:phosphoribosyl-AMP cyclohydrolase
VSATAGTARTITLAATDVDGDALTYTVATPSKGSATISGSTLTYTPTSSASGTDSFVVTARDPSGATATQTINVTLASSNRAPSFSSSSQSVSTSEDTSSAISVSATDADGDALTYSVTSSASNGTTSVSGGTVTYTPRANYNGTDSFVVTAADGKGGTATQTVNVTVASVNDAPSFSSSSQAVSATAGTARTITLAATDVDGDALTYTVATPSKGSATISGSTLTYTPTSSASGTDSFVVTARDPSGATATQTINVTVTTASTTASSSTDFRVTASDGWTGAIGGNGLVYGTSGYQDIKVLSGAVTFDASFNKGGDIVRFDAAASSYTVARAGSSAQINAGTDLSAVIPIGTIGTVTSFSDGVRKLVFANSNFALGGQTFSTSATTISAAADGTSLPTGASSSASARISLAGNDLRSGQTSHITIGGKAIIYGNAAKADVVAIASGVNVDLTFDASFNRGGDTIILDKSAGSYSAVRSGASIILTSTDQKFTIPVGTTSTTIKFADDSRALVYSTSQAAIKLGTQTIATTSTAISSSSVMTSLDVGTSSSTTTVSGANGKVIFTDDATKSSYVKITNFGSDDIIRVTGATEGQYSFTNADLDGDGQADDLSITFSNPDAGIVNDIQIINAVSSTAFVGDMSTAISAVGFNFISFG